MKSITSAITSYNNIMYNSRPATYHEYISDKYNKIHTELYNDALKKYYNILVNDIISPYFIFIFLKMMTNINGEENFDEFYNKILNFKDNTILTSLNILSINNEEYCRTMFDKVSEYILNLKNTIVTGKNNMSVLEGITNIANISDFRIIYVNNSEYLAAETDSEDEDETWGQEFYVSNNDIMMRKFIMSELDDNDDKFLILLETDHGVRIGYNIKGEFLLILDSAKYNSVDLHYFINHYIQISNKNMASDFKNVALDLYKQYHKILEIKNTEYWMASSIISISSVKPFNKTIVDLSPYWNYTQDMSECNINDIKMSNENINDAEILELNYIRGKAKVRSKSSDIEFEVPFNYLNEDVEVNEDLGNINFIS